MKKKHSYPFSGFRKDGNVDRDEYIPKPYLSRNLYTVGINRPSRIRVRIQPISSPAFAFNIQNYEFKIAFIGSKGQEA